MSCQVKMSVTTRKTPCPEIKQNSDLSALIMFLVFSPQTKLHDTVCKRRRVATIATHNLNSISPPLRYSCGPAPSITFTPLNAATPITVEQFMASLESSKQETRRGGGGGGGKGKGKKGGQSHTAQPPVDPVTAALSKYVLP